MWLPLPHLLLLPFALSIELFSTGLAGAWTEGGVTWGNQPGTTGSAATLSHLIRVMPA